jgi:hypothetical protein
MTRAPLNWKVARREMADEQKNRYHITAISSSETLKIERALNHNYAALRRVVNKNNRNWGLTTHLQAS